MLVEGQRRDGREEDGRETDGKGKCWRKR